MHRELLRASSPIMATQHSRMHPESPHSSAGGAESFGGTPDTRFTVFTPETQCGKRDSKNLGGVALPRPVFPPVQLSRSAQEFRGFNPPDPFSILGAPTNENVQSSGNSSLRATVPAFEPGRRRNAPAIANGAHAEAMRMLQGVLAAAEGTFSVDVGISRAISISAAPGDQLLLKQCIDVSSLVVRFSFGILSFQLHQSLASRYLLIFNIFLAFVCP
jgi:hypothetical protein